MCLFDPLKTSIAISGHHHAMTNWVQCPHTHRECSRSELICPTGCFANRLSSPLCKNILLHRLVDTALLIPPSTPHEGRIAIVTDAGLDAMDAAATQDERR
jgi:hypothetical protein